jgi:hypothetical protein
LLTFTMLWNLKSSMQLHISAALGIVIGVGLSSGAADRVALRRDADLLKQKMTAIQGRTSSASRKPVRTTITEREVNAYLAFEVADALPDGVVDPTVTILGPGRLSGRAVVDLDRVRKERNPTSMLDPFYYLTGRVPVGATGVLRASGGVGQFELQSADVAGLPVPTFVVQQIVSHYSRSAGWPGGLKLESSFALPARIREIQVERGHAIVIQ